MSTKKEKIKFSKAFWVSNLVELFERAAYYGVFIVITLYLSRILGFNDIESATIAGVFSACLYLLPTFAGALADKIGFYDIYDLVSKAVNAVPYIANPTLEEILETEQWTYARIESRR